MNHQEAFYIDDRFIFKEFVIKITKQLMTQQDDSVIIVHVNSQQETTHIELLLTNKSQKALIAR